MLRKGNQIAITGEITLTEYQDKQGQTKYSLDCRVSDVTLLGSRDAPEGTHPAQKANGKPDEGKPDYFPDDDSDSIPF